MFLFLFFFFSFSHFSIFFNVKNGATPLYIAAQQGHEQIVQILLEKGNSNVDLETKVILLIVSFFFSLSHFSIFFNAKGGFTPLHIAAFQGHEQIVQILLEQREPNVDLETKVILLIVSFFFTFSFFYFFFNVKDGFTPLYIAAQNGHEQIVQFLLEKGANVDLADQVILLIVSFSFHFLIFLFFFKNVKTGVTPLYIAAQNGHEQIVQFLLEKGKPNVDLATEVLLLIVFFLFLFHFLIFLFFFV